MVKAAALYLVIIVSLLIAIISATLLTIAFYYRMEVKKKERLDKLMLNSGSATEILLSGNFNKYDTDELVDLFGAQQDSLILRKEHWGVFDLGLSKAFELKDTLKRGFLIGNEFTDPAVIYLADEDRPLSVSGSTMLKGDGELPKSGLKKAYVEGKPFAGKEMINGKVRNSSRDVPPLNDKILEEIAARLKKKPLERLPFKLNDSTGNTFFNVVKVYRMNPGLLNIGKKKITGKIILQSDTTITIDQDSELDQVQVYAPVIRVMEGFKGNCQLFARDSIIIGKNCTFSYPSFAGVFKPDGGKIQPRINIAEGVQFSGMLLSYEKKRSEQQTMIALGKGVKINGEVFATGYINLEKGVKVNGKVYAKRFMMRISSALYENYLIDITLDRSQLSKYYLTSLLLKGSKPVQNVLSWVN